MFEHIGISDIKNLKTASPAVWLREIYSTVDLPQFYSGNSNEQTQATLPVLKRLLIHLFASEMHHMTEVTIPAHVLCQLIDLECDGGRYYSKTE
jgi:hypothetical protein